MTDLTTSAPASVADDTASRSWTRRLPLLIFGALVVAAAAWGIRRYLWSRHHVTTDNAQVDGHITAIAPRIAGFVTRVYVDDNQRVKMGDTLVTLDDRDLKVRLEQAEAELRTAEAAAGSRKQTGQAGAQLETTRAQASSAEAEVAAAEAAFQKASADLERYRGLAQRKIVAAQQLDAAQAAFDAAQANLQAARRQAVAAKSQVTATGAALRGADARVAAAQAAADNARLQLGYATITAPTDGVVAKRSVEPGSLVQVGQQLMSIVPEREVWVTANLKETQLDDLAIGDPVSFTVDAYDDRTFHGRVASVSPATGARFALLPPDNATGNFTKVVQRVPVRIDVTEPPDTTRPLRPGMSVDVTITTR